MFRINQVFLTPLLLGILVTTIGAAGQAGNQQPSPASGTSTAPAATTKLLLREGTEVKLKFADDLTSKTATEGDPVNLVLDESIKVGDVVVVREGAKAVGAITNAKKAGMMGARVNSICVWSTSRLETSGSSCAAAKEKRAKEKKELP